MEITLMLNIDGRKYVNFGGENLQFHPTEVNWGDFESGIIDIFVLLERLVEKFDIKNINQFDKLDIILGRNESLKITGSEKLKNISEINLNGRGQSFQLIKVVESGATLNLTHCTLDNLFLEEGFGTINIEKDISIKKIIISGTGKQFNAKDLRIDKELNLNGANIKHELLLENIAFLSDANDSAKFTIYGCSIGKLSIKNLELPANGLAISNSKILEAFFYKTNLEKLKLIGVTGRGFGNLIKGENESSEMKEFYRQLKHSHDEIGNKTEANKFFAKEMEYYEKSLSWSDWDKKLISFIQRYSNNYGNSWLRPSFGIILVSFLYTFSFDCWSFHCSCGGMQDWSCFSNHWLRNVSQFPTELKNAKDWWFFFYAIIMGSLFYQLLVALRRISQR